MTEHMYSVVTRSKTDRVAASKVTVVEDGTLLFIKKVSGGDQLPVAGYSPGEWIRFYLEEVFGAIQTESERQNTNTGKAGKELGSKIYPQE